MKKILVLLFVILALVACKKDTKLETYKVVITDEITSLSSTDASIVAKYTYISKLNIKLLYGTNTNMSETAVAVEHNNTYIFDLENLTPNTKYFYCFSYSNSLSSEKSEIKNFNTPADSTGYNVSVSIKAITDITTSSAKSGGNIQVDGDTQILGRGVCYSVNHNPTINDSITSDGSGPGVFDSMLNDLSDNTVYYVKAYAKTMDSVFYSDELSFTTLSYALPVVLTSPVTDISNNSAICGGNVTDEGDASVLVKGVCWSKEENPTLNDSFTMDGNGLGVFSSQMAGLQANTGYYVKSYVTNAYGTSYGQQVYFETDDQYGDCCFSVSESNKILFSSGNLQYNPSSNSWRFAENQYDFIGDDNQNISPNYNGWLDLFGWATSGYNGCYPWLNTTNQTEYGGAITSLANTSYDWGVFNEISGSSENWRTLTNSEWDYILNQRENAANLRAKATVCGIQGFLILPDKWVKPSVVSYDPDATNWTTNNYNSFTWTYLNDSHAIFLPAAGYRSGTSIYVLNNNGGYWSSDASGDKSAMFLLFTESTFTMTTSSRHVGRSVPLVRDY